MHSRRIRSKVTNAGEKIKARAKAKLRTSQKTQRQSKEVRNSSGTGILRMDVRFASSSIMENLAMGAAACLTSARIASAKSTPFGKKSAGKMMPEKLLGGL